jgi:hypothetical protein
MHAILAALFSVSIGHKESKTMVPLVVGPPAVAGYSGWVGMTFVTLIVVGYSNQDASKDKCIHSLNQ